MNNTKKNENMSKIYTTFIDWPIHIFRNSQKDFGHWLV